MTATRTRPDPRTVGPRAAQILAAIHGDAEYGLLIETCRLYNSDWTCMSGTITIDRFDLASDAEPLIEEALRALAIKSAVWELTRFDEALAEVGIPLPVDEVCHAVTAQHALINRMTSRTDVTFIHATDLENDADPYETGGYTTACYTRAYGQEPPARYWLDTAESARRCAILKTRYDSIGLHDMGRQHGIVFADQPEPLAR